MGGRGDARTMQETKRHRAIEVTAKRPPFSSHHEKDPQPRPNQDIVSNILRPI